MSSLTGQQINQTYKSLLKLSDSSTGVTSTLQAVEDGLGNNTGVQLATNLLTAPNLVSIPGFLPDYMGNGVQSTAGGAMNTSAFNKLQYNYFYDSGLYSYSAVTLNLSQVTSTSDVVELLIYSLQWVPTIGIAPKDLIMSGISITSTGSTGLVTTALPSTLSFSGTGGGFYIYALYVQNSGVAPTVRYGGPTTGVRSNGYVENLGWVLSTPGTGIVNGSRVALSAGPVGMLLDRTPQTTFTAADISTYQSNSQITGLPGIALHVIK